MKNLEQFMEDKIEEIQESIKYHEEKLFNEEHYLSYMKSLSESDWKKGNYNYEKERARKDVEWRKEQIQNERYMLDILYTARDCKADNLFNYKYSVT